uniref:Bm57 n=1 Tax=Brugia malayi TaxID=6279 RepID=A0A1U7EZT4_BRUMA|nr:Bm57 [Brugia malayi]
MKNLNRSVGIDDTDDGNVKGEVIGNCPEVIGSCPECKVNRSSIYLI